MGSTADSQDVASKTLRDGAGSSRSPLWFALLLVAGVFFVALGFVVGRGVFSTASGRMRLEHNAPVQVGNVGPGNGLASASATMSVGAGMVEVPQLRGMRADEASVILESAGFGVAFLEVGREVSSAESRTVQAQDPAAGTIVSTDSTVSLAVPPFASEASTGSSAPSSVVKTKFVVCIDPGHQAHTDVKLEPIGPGSKTEKPRATGGATGVSSGVPEYEIALQVSTNLKRRLEAAGVRVVMTRTTNDVSLPNSARAAIANKARANLFVRIHGGVSTDSADSGVSTLYPALNQWTHPIIGESRAAARGIERALCEATSATEQGAKTEAGLAGFNWSKVPSVIVEVGYLSNPVEDRLLASPGYQDRVAQGIADGVMAYLGSTER
jgi:N-acetylmuramoyl-L-alanine amidase